MTIADAVRQIGVTQQTYYRWRKLYGGMGRAQLKRLKELEKENQRLRRAVFLYVKPRPRSQLFSALRPIRTPCSYARRTTISSSVISFRSPIKPTMKAL